MKVIDLFKKHTGGIQDAFSNNTPDVIERDVVEIHEEFFRYKDKASEWRHEAAECDRFRNGLQWTKEQLTELERRKQAPIVVNLLSPGVDQLKSMLTSNNPRFNALPREGSDRKTAELFSDLFAWIWDYNRGNKKLKKTVDYYSVRGLGYLMAWWDPQADFGKGEIIIDCPNPMHVYVDPNSVESDFSDAQSIIIARDYTAEQIQRTLRIDSKFLRKAITTSDERDLGFIDDEVPQIDEQRDKHHSLYRVVDHYAQMLRPYCHYKYEEYEYNTSKDDSGEYEKTPVLQIINTEMESMDTTTSWVIEEDELSMWAEMIRQFGSIFHFILVPDPETGQEIEQPMPGPAGPNAVRQLDIEQGTIADMLSSGAMDKNEYTEVEIHRHLAIGYRTYFKGWTGLTEYPIKPFCNRHNGNPYPVSDIQLSKMLQKELNKIRSIILTHAANTASLKLGLPKGSMARKDVESELEKSGVSVFEYEAIDGAGPVFMYPPQLPSHFYQSEEKIREAIYEILGIYPFMQGGQSGHPTSSGILIMDEFAQRRIAAKRTDIEEALNSFAKVIVQLIQLHYTEEKTVRIVQPSGRYNEININSPVYDQFSGRLLHRINDVTVGKYDVVVASGSTLPTNRITRLEYFMKLFAQGLIDQYEVLKNVDEVDVEGVMERMGILQSMAAQIEEMQGQIKALEGDLQTADREAVSARKRTEVEKFKANLSNMAANIQAQLEVTKERQASAFREGLSEQTGRTGAEGPAPVVMDEELYNQINQLQ